PCRVVAVPAAAWLVLRPRPLAPRSHAEQLQAELAVARAAAEQEAEDAAQAKLLQEQQLHDKVKAFADIQHKARGVLVAKIHKVEELEKAAQERIAADAQVISI